MRRFLLATLLLVPLAPASAQTFTPLSGPNTPVPSPICDLVNFGFCPQPAPPPPDLPDIAARDAVAPPRPLPPPPRVRHHRVHHHPVAPY